MMKQYDVVVIGAGPAGSTAAKHLAERGYRVLVAERCRLPRYKSCSGVLIRKSLELIQRYYGEPVPHSTMCTPTGNRGMIFTNDRGREFRFEQEGLNIWRSSFDAWLLQKAVEQGVECLDETSAVSCRLTPDFAEVTLKGKTNQTVQTAYIIDCEGATGLFKRRLTGEKRDSILTYQSFCTGTIHLDPHYFYAYLQPELSEYDAWFNVKDDMLVLGVAVRNFDLASWYHERFLSYMAQHYGLRVNRVIRSEKWIMPHIRPGCHIDHGAGRVLFAGEIAGFLNPMGEGISAGMESAFCAAEAVTANFHAPEQVLREYQRLTEPLSAYVKRQWELVSYMADTFSEMRPQ